MAMKLPFKEHARAKFSNTIIICGESKMYITIEQKDLTGFKMKRSNCTQASLLKKIWMRYKISVRSALTNPLDR